MSPGVASVTLAILGNVDRWPTLLSSGGTYSDRNRLKRPPPRSCDPCKARGCRTPHHIQDAKRKLVDWAPLRSARRSRRDALAPSWALSESHFGTGLGALRSHRPAVGQSVRRAMRRAEGPSTLRRLSAQSGRLRAWTAPLRRSRAQELRAAQRAAQRDVAHSAGTHVHGLAFLPRTASYGQKSTHQLLRISAWPRLRPRTTAALRRPRPSL